VFVTALSATVELVGCTLLVYGCFSDDAMLTELFCPCGLYTHLLHILEARFGVLSTEPPFSENSSLRWWSAPRFLLIHYTVYHLYFVV